MCTRLRSQPPIRCQESAVCKGSLQSMQFLPGNDHCIASHIQVPVQPAAAHLWGTLWPGTQQWPAPSVLQVWKVFECCLPSITVHDCRLFLYPWPGSCIFAIALCLQSLQCRLLLLLRNSLSLGVQGASVCMFSAIHKQTLKRECRTFASRQKVLIAAHAC